MAGCTHTGNSHAYMCVSELILGYSKSSGLFSYLVGLRVEPKISHTLDKCLTEL